MVVISKRNGKKIKAIFWHGKRKCCYMGKGILMSKIHKSSPSLHSSHENSQFTNIIFVKEKNDCIVGSKRCKISIKKNI